MYMYYEIITVISLVNVYHLTVTLVFLGMGYFKIYSPRNFKYNIVLMTIGTLLCIKSSELTFLIPGSLYL